MESKTYSVNLAQIAVVVLAVVTVQLQALDLSSPLLPDSLPPGDPTNYALPIFLSPPKAAFTSKDREAVLECKVAHSIKVFFICDGEELPSSSEEEGVDPQSGTNYKLISISIKKGQVLDTLAEYTCVCRAQSQRGEVESPPATVEMAYLRKDFVTPPYSTHIELGSQAELRCHPPQGLPPARVVSWLRNGVPIQTDGSDSNFIISSTGHLLILQARLQDTANYSCVARNVARQRTSQPALVTVYIPGSWGHWAEWTSCNVECGRGLQVRQRTCDSPAPVNGGPGCVGPPIQKKSCGVQCPHTDGGWASWDSWAACTTDCLQVRRRSCSSPTPTNGGRYCQGKDLHSRTCHGGLCRPHIAHKELPVQSQGGSSHEGGSSSGLATSDLTLYIGLAVAALILILVIFIIVRLLQRKRTPHAEYSYTPAGYTAAPKPGSNLSYGPDLTHGQHHQQAAGSVCYEYTYSDNNSNTSSKSAKASGAILSSAQFSELRPLSEHFYEQPMRMLPPSGQSPHSSLDRATPSLPPTSLGLPRCADTAQTSWTRVGEAGAKVSVARTAVSLTVPKGAIEPGRTEEVWVCVVASTSTLASPTLEAGQALITPVVVVGPLHLTAHLKKPVVVSIPHCGGPGLSQVRVLQCDRLEGPGCVWRCVAVSGQEDKTSNTAVYVDSGMCQLVTERLAAFALVAQAGELGGRSVGTSSSGCSSLGSTPNSDNAPFRIPLPVKQSLSQLLDPATPGVADWRELAERLGVTRYSGFFSSQPSPTEAILNLWEARNRESTAVAGLVNTLRGMGRHDAAQVLDMDTSWP